MTSRRFSFLFLLFSSPAWAIPGGFSTSTIDGSNPSVALGSHTVMAIDQTGRIRIWYYDGQNGDLKAAIKEPGNNWATMTVDSTGNRGKSVSLAIDGNNHAYASYLVANGANYDVWIITPTETGYGTSLVASGNYDTVSLDVGVVPHILYKQGGGGTSLTYSRYNGSSWITESIESGTGSSRLLVDDDEKPHMVYEHMGILEYRRQINGAWQTTQIVNTAWGTSFDFALDGKKNPHVAYRHGTDYDVYYTSSSDNGASWSTPILVDAGSLTSFGWGISLALDGAGFPYISYHDTNPALKLASWSPPSFSTQTIDTLPFVENWGVYSSLAIDAQGFIHIAYFDDANDDVKYASSTAGAVSRPMGGNDRGKVQMPTNFRTTTVYTTSATFSWNDNSNNESGFKLYASTSFAGPYSLIAGTATIPGDQTSYTYTNFIPGASFYAYIGAMNDGGVVTSSYTLFQTLPQAPTYFAGSPIGSSSITWSWSPSSGTATAYRIYTSTGGVLTTVTVPPYSWAETGLSPNTNYIRFARAINGSLESSNISPAASTYTFAAIPTNLAVSNVGVSSFTLSWDANSNPTGTKYEVHLATVSNFSWLDGSLVTYNTSVVFSGQGQYYYIMNGTTYYMRVMAYNTYSIGSGTSSSVSTSTLPGDTPVLAASALSPTSIKWYWDNVNGETSYRVANIVSQDLSGNLAADTTSWIETNLSSNTQNGRVVLAFYNGGPKISSLASKYTLAAAPGAISFPSVGISSLTLSWASQGNSTATVYETSLSTDNFIAHFSTPIALSANFIAVSTNLVSLTPRTTYYFRTRAQNGEAVATGFNTAASTYTKAAQPANLSVAEIFYSSVTLNWSVNNNPANTPYRVSYWALTGSTTTLSVIALSTSITGLSQGTQYSFELAAIGIDGSLTMPEASSATTKALTEASSDQGGTVVAQPKAGVEIKLEIPPNAFSETVVLTLNPAPSLPEATEQAVPLRLSSIGFEIVPDKSLQPVRELTITVSYTDNDMAGFNEERLSCARYHPSRGIYVPLVSQVDTSSNKVVCPTDHLSIFRIVEILPQETLEGVLVFPNPVKPSKFQRLTFSQLPQDTEIFIYTYSGELIRELKTNTSGLASWDVKNTGGERVASGVYVVLIKASGSKKVIRVAVER